MTVTTCLISNFLPLDTEWNKHFPASKFVAICNPWAKSKLPNLLLETSTSQFHLASNYFLTEIPCVSSSMWRTSSSTLLTVFVLLPSIFWRLEIAFSLSPWSPDPCRLQEPVHPSFRNQFQLQKPKICWLVKAAPMLPCSEFSWRHDWVRQSPQLFSYILP